jgi:predicted nucleic acid-binding protein
MRFILDNSVTMRWLLQGGSRDRIAYADSILALMAQGDTEAVVPSIWPLEVASVILKAESSRAVDEARSTAFVALLNTLPVSVDDHTAARALSDCLQLARRYKLSSYDASYLELALREGLPLATLDGDLRKAMVRAGVPLA